jgi:uncharacterized repeat protein (TIGR01451 family)
MFEVRRGWKVWGVAALVVLGLATTLQAASGPEVKVRLNGSVQGRPNSGVAWISLKDGTQVAPGEKILYTVDLTNDGGQSARNPVALGPVPAGTAFVPGTATTGPDLKVDYSIDGGKTFSAKPTVTVTGKDGRPQVVPAPPETYTTIRWTWGTPLPAGATASVSYQVQVR